MVNPQIRSAAIADIDHFMKTSDVDFDIAGKFREELLHETEENPKKSYTVARTRALLS